ncbi:hypothetical protein GCM10010433_61710 [Streptomyces pulveraceus]
MARSSVREVAQEAGISHGSVQHYFATREEMLVFAMDFASEQTSLRVAESIRELGNPPHPRDMLRLILTEVFPLHPDTRATSRMNAAYVLEALHNANIRTRTRNGLIHGRRSSARQSLMATSTATAPRRQNPIHSWHSPA